MMYFREKRQQRLNYLAAAGKSSQSAACQRKLQKQPMQRKQFK